MCQGRFVNCNKCPCLVGDIACVGAGCIWKMSVLSFQFSCESKTAKNDNNNNNNNKVFNFLENLFKK